MVADVGHEPVVDPVAVGVSTSLVSVGGGEVCLHRRNLTEPGGRLQSHLDLTERTVVATCIHEAEAFAERHFSDDI